MPIKNKPGPKMSITIRRTKNVEGVIYVKLGIKYIDEGLWKWREGPEFPWLKAGDTLELSWDRDFDMLPIEPN